MHPYPDTAKMPPRKTVGPTPIPASMPAYSYEAILRASERVQWDVADLIGGDKRLDFSKPFLPESFARTEELDFLSPEDRRLLNQIRGHAYLSIFVVVEEFILPFVLEHARAHVNEGESRVRAFLGFAGEEAKHIELFKRFRTEFERGFGRRCDVIGPSDAIGKQILSHDALAVALTILHIEWMTQRHFIDSVRDDTGLDPLFKSLLRHHWMEEAQHAKLDTLMVESIAAGMTREEIAKGVEDYLDIGGFLDAGLRQQAELDMASLERAMGRVMSPSQRERFLTVQHQANRWTYLGSGMTHPSFLGTLGFISPEGRAKIEAVAPTFA